MADLLPCPFCGGHPYDSRHLTYGWWGVTCACGAKGPTFRAQDTDEAKRKAYAESVSAWNRRTPPAGDAQPHKVESA